MPRLSTYARTSAVYSTAQPTIDVYTGAIPATGDTSPTGTLLVSLTPVTWSAPAAGVSNATVPLTSAAPSATGTVGYARLWDGGAGLSMFCTVGTAGADLNFSTLTVIPSITTCKIYSGTKPASDASAPTGTLLVNFSGGLPWATATAATGVATGTAGYARISDGTTSIYCSIGTSSGFIRLGSLSITNGGAVTLTTGSSGGEINLTSASLVWPAS